MGARRSIEPLARARGTKQDSVQINRSMTAGKELRWRWWDEVLVSLIERVRVADDLEPVPNAGIAHRRGGAVSVLVQPGSAAGRLIEEDVHCVLVTRRDAEGRRQGRSP